MGPPAMSAIPLSNSSLVHYAVVTKQFPVEYDTFFKKHALRFKVRCPWCVRVCRHGMAIDPVIHTSGEAVNERRQCDWCFHEYRVLVVI